MMLVVGEGFQRTDCPRCNRGRKLSKNPDYLCLWCDPQMKNLREQLGLQEPGKEIKDVDGDE